MAEAEDGEREEQTRAMMPDENGGESRLLCAWSRMGQRRVSGQSILPPAHHALRRGSGLVGRPMRRCSAREPMQGVPQNDKACARDIGHPMSYWRKLRA